MIASDLVPLSYLLDLSIAANGLAEKLNVVQYAWSVESCLLHFWRSPRLIRVL